MIKPQLNRIYRNRAKIYPKDIILRLYRTSTKAHLELNQIEKEIIIGSLLGDLSAEKKNPNSNVRLQFKQSVINKEYIDHLWAIFQTYCGSKPIILARFDSRPNKMKEYKAIKFQTLSLPCFNIYRTLFYNPEGVKIIPHNLEELLSARGLAYWIMDDGYRSGKGLYISTESFSQSDNQKIVNLLKNKFDLDSNMHLTTNGYRIYIFSTSINKLIELIKPFLIKHFYYKLGL